MASFTLKDNSNSTSGTYGPNDSFTLTLMGTWSGFTANGFSLWLETNTALASHLTITNETYTTFVGATDNGFPKAFNDTSGRTTTGFLTDHDTVPNPQSGTIDSGDLGATGAPQVAGTYQLATITFQLNGAPLGTFSLETTTVSPKASEISDTSFVDHNAVTDIYGITIVPEPATISLIVLGSMGSMGLTILRARTRR
jgi:hypothetical protein